MAGKRKAYDWEAIEKDYRANQLSNCEISRKYNVPESTIRYRAKRYNWTKILVNFVREQVKEELLREDLRGVAETDSEIIAEAASIGANIVRSQRKDIAALRDLESKLLAELTDNPTKLYITQYKGEVIQKTVGIAVTEKAAALNHLSSVQQKRIQLERQAFNLDDDPTVNNQSAPKARIIVEGVTPAPRDGGEG